MSFKESAGNDLVSNAQIIAGYRLAVSAGRSGDAGAAGAEHVPARSAPTDRMKSIYLHLPGVRLTRSSGGYACFGDGGCKILTRDETDEQPATHFHHGYGADSFAGQ